MKNQLYSTELTSARVITTGPGCRPGSETGDLALIYFKNPTVSWVWWCVAPGGSVGQEDCLRSREREPSLGTMVRLYLKRKEKATRASAQILPLPLRTEPCICPAPVQEAECKDAGRHRRDVTRTAARPLRREVLSERCSSAFHSCE